MNKTLQANIFFRSGKYSEALALYTELASENPIWAKILESNISMCRKNLGLSLFDDKASTGADPRFGYSDSLPTRVKKVLISDFRYPRFDSSAGELATFGIIKMFVDLGYAVTFIPKESTDQDDRYINALRQIGVNCKINVDYEKFKNLILEEAKDISIAYIFRPDVAEVCLPRIRSVNLDAFIFYHAPDVYFRRENRQSEVESKDGVSSKSTQELDALLLSEINAVLGSDHVICVSDEDSNALHTALHDPKKNILGVPSPSISVFPILFLKPIISPPNFENTKNICFVGSSEHTPNKDAIRWFLTHVWEKISKINLILEFHIIGKTDEAEKKFYESFTRVTVLGWVESIENTITKYRASVAPIRYGAGIKGKVGISLINGIPCIATSIAAEDMGFISGESILIANEADEFINQITLVTSDKQTWSKLSNLGLLKSKELYSEEATFLKFLHILNVNGVLDSNIYMNFIRRKSKENNKINFKTNQSSYDISIIVPAYNNLELSRECMTSIHFSTLPINDFNFEVIYADDSSDPKVIDAIKLFSQTITISKTEQNVGFVQNCNTAAKHAKGKYIVLLNNDAITLPGWLESLFFTIKSVEGCKVAGSKLLYSNLKIQEAGAGIWTDGRTSSIGRGVDGSGLESNLEEYNFIREVDYVSFASVIIEADFWRKVGGLGEDYGFGYYDDSDFCMKVRDSGFVTLFAPGSEVIHNESKSFSQRSRKLVANGVKNNQIHFRDKWSEILLRKHLPYELPSWDVGYSESICKANASRHRIEFIDTEGYKAKRRHILYFSPFPSHPASHGNQTTIQEFGRFMQAEGFAVHFVLLKSHMFTQKDANEMKAQWDTFDIINVEHFPSCNGEDIRYDGWYIPGLGEQISLLCSKYKIDTVICSYIFQSRLLDFIPNYVLKIIDTHDQFTDRYTILDKLKKQREFFSCTRQHEGMYLSRADVVFARRDEETRYFDSISTAKVFTVPHIEKRMYLNKGDRDLKKVGIVASCNLINLDIVITFLAELIKQKSADWGFEVLIAGEVKSLLNPNDPVHKIIQSHPLISFIGYIDKIADFYGDIDMVLCPIMSGTGINVKTVQAFAHGMPVLSTDHATKGVASKFDNHHFKSVRDLVHFLLNTKFKADLLADYCNQSKSIFDTFIESGYDNFRNALKLTQEGLRPEIGNVKKSSLATLFSKKSTYTTLVKLRKQRIGREYMIQSVIQNLKDFGPTWIDSSKELPNIQADGGIGFYFAFKHKISFAAEFFLRVEGNPYKLYVSSDKMLFTTSLPASIFKSPKDLNLNLEVRFGWEENDILNQEYPRLATVKIV